MIATHPFPKRFDIWLVCLNPTVGSEIKKTHPVLIIQNDIGNEYAPKTIVAPITSTIYKSPVTVEIQPTNDNGLSHPSCINCAQIRCVDKARLIKKLGTLDPNYVIVVNNALQKSLGM